MKHHFLASWFLVTAALAGAAIPDKAAEGLRCSSRFFSLTS